MKRNGIVALVTVVCLVSAMVGAAPGRPALTVTSARDRLSRISPRVQVVVDELDGSARASVLMDTISAARAAKDLLRWALELQSVIHDRNGNYLFKLYLMLEQHDPSRARELAELLAQEGIALGPSSGHFEQLEHLDPAAPLPPQPANGRASQVAMERWVDAFVRADYDLSYRPNRRGALSEFLQLTYADGGVLDLDIRLISDNYDPAPNHAMAYAYVGPGERLFPLRLGRSTTTRLWRAKHEIVLAAMYRSNQEYETMVGISVAGIMSTMPLGLVVPVQPPRSPGIAARARTAGAPGPVERASASPTSRSTSSTPAATAPSSAASGATRQVVPIADQRMWQLGRHFAKHGRSMGFESKSAYETAAREFATQYQGHPAARVFQGIWGGKGQLAGQVQRAVTYKGRTVVFNPKTGQLIDFYEGAEMRGLIKLVELP